MRRHIYIIILPVLSTLLLFVMGYIALTTLNPDDNERDVVSAPEAEERSLLEPAFDESESPMNNSAEKPQSFPKPRSGDRMNPYFISYMMHYQSFHQFVKRPSLELLLKYADDKGTRFSLSEMSLGLIRREVYREDSVSIREDIPNVMRLCLHFVVGERLIRFAGDMAELQAYLAQHGVTDEIEYVAVLQAAAIWIQAGGESLFIDVEWSDTEYIDGVMQPIYSYQFYTQAEFYELMHPTDGTLIVNGRDLTDKDHVTFQRELVGIPLLTVLRTLGAGVQWLDDNTAFIVYEGKEFTLNMAEMSLFEVGGGSSFSENLLMLPVGATGILRAVDSDIVVDVQTTMWQIARAMGISVHINRGDRTVTIG